MKLKNALALVLTIMFTLSGCSGGGNDSSPSVATKKEIWGGTYSYLRANFNTGTNLFDSIILRLNINGETVSGQYETTAGGEGSVTGTKTNKTISLTLTQSLPGCPGSFSINGQVSSNGKDVVADFSGSDCTGDYSNGNARILIVPSEPAGTDFTGQYYGNNINTLYFLSTSTQNGTDYSGSVTIINDDLTIMTANVSGSLGNDGTTSLMRMDLTDIVNESTVDFASGSMSTHDMYQDNTGLNRLRVSWDFRYNGGGGIGTGGVDMLQLK